MKKKPTKTKVVIPTFKPNIPPEIIEWKQPEQKPVDWEMLIVGIFIGIAASVITVILALYL